ncbi:MAG: asparaginase domain-containing protein [bacterium]|nr:asparaginase domain-containing protein [bacterium]
MSEWVKRMHLMIFTTGGSIDKAYSTQASDFVVGEPQIGAVLREANVNFTYEVVSLFKKDSLHITDDDRRLLTDHIRATPYRHILVTHGTDTMVQTAQAIVGIEGKVILLTGAMQPAAFKQTDAVLNIGCAVAAVQIMPPGVYLAMSGRIFTPDNARKNPQTDQFEEVG